MTWVPKSRPDVMPLFVQPGDDVEERNGVLRCLRADCGWGSVVAHPVLRAEEWLLHRQSHGGAV